MKEDFRKAWNANAVMKPTTDWNLFRDDIADWWLDKFLTMLPPGKVIAPRYVDTPQGVKAQGWNDYRRELLAKDYRRELLAKMDKHE